MRRLQRGGRGIVFFLIKWTQPDCNRGRAVLHLRPLQLPWAFFCSDLQQFFPLQGSGRRCGALRCAARAAAMPRGCFFLLPSLTHLRGRWLSARLSPGTCLLPTVGLPCLTSASPSRFCAENKGTRDCAANAKHFCCWNCCLGSLS